VRGGDIITLTSKSLGGLEIRKLEERDAYYDIFIYGDAGVGKTVFAGSADAVPQMRPVLIVDVEFGTNSLRKTYPKVDVIQVKTWEEVEKIERRCLIPIMAIRLWYGILILSFKKLIFTTS